MKLSGCEIPAADIVQAIEAGEYIEIHHATIVGQLSLYALPVKHPILISHCRFTGSVEVAHIRANSILALRECEFEENMFLANCTFDAGLILTKASLKREARIMGCFFAGILILEGAKASRGMWLDGCVMKHGANLRELTCRASFSFVAVESHGTLEFDGSEWQGPVRFLNMVAGQYSRFKDCLFKEESKWDGAEFRGGLSLQEAVFEGPVSFNGAFLGKSLLCPMAEFARDAKFQSIKVAGNAVFDQATFRGRADFASARVEGQCSFKGAWFFSNANFGGASLAGGAFFDRARFKEEVHFNHIRAELGAQFIGAHFLGDAEFAVATIKRELILNGTTFHSNVGFGNAKLDCIGFDPNTTRLRGVIELGGCTYNQVEHLEAMLEVLKRLKRPSRQPYQVLEVSLINEGEESKARRVFYEGKKAAWKRMWHTKQYVRWLGNSVVHILTGWGVKLRRLVVAHALLLGLGTFAFSQPGAVVTADGTPHLADTSLCLLQSLLFTLDTFLPTSIPTGLEVSPSYQVFCCLPFAAWATVLTILGWVIVPVSIAGVTGLLRR